MMRKNRSVKSMQKNFKGSPKNILGLAICLLFILGVVFVFISEINIKNKPFLMSPPSEPFVQRDKLEEALATASTISKTFIIAIVNKAYVEGDMPMLDMFLDGFWLGEGTRDLISNLLIVAMDQISYERCKFLKLHCYKLETEGVDFTGEKVYMSNAFIKMMWRRTLFLGDVLKRGYNFIFTDTDVLWVKDPFPYLNLNQTLDLQISTDRFNGDEWSELNRVNTGYYMVRSNNKTIVLFDTWYAMKDNSTQLKEQDVLQSLVHQRLFTKLGLRVRFLDTMYFSGFCHNSHNPAVVSTIHANCCRGIAAKLVDLRRVVHDLRRYKTSKGLMFKWTNHSACWDSWKNLNMTFNFSTGEV